MDIITQPQLRYKKGDKVGGRYQVHQALMGGMGEVYLCLDLEEMHPYALKTFQQRYLSQSQLLRQAFEKEVATWVALEKHPNIVRCFYMDTFDNQPFMVLEWIAGEEGRGTDLRGWLRHGPLDLKLALEIIIDICRGLIHAQEKQPGLVHRDLKPENILMAQGGLAKVTDFGLVQIVQTTGLTLDAAVVETDRRQSVVGRPGIVGTPAYMPPEQWRGESLDQRTDIYALGCILYELLTGQQLFQVKIRYNTPQQQWLDALRKQHETENLASSLNTIPDDFAEILHQCLSKSISDRPHSLIVLLDLIDASYQKYFSSPPKNLSTPGEFTVSDYGNRGITYDKLQQYKLAFADFNRAIEIEPHNAKTYSNRGLTYANLQQYELALADFNRAIELDPNFVLVYSNRGLTYKALHHYELALIDFNQAIQLEPNYATAYSNRGNLYQLLQQYELASSDFSRAIELNPNFAEAHFNLGAALINTEQVAQAMPYFEKAAQLGLTQANQILNQFRQRQGGTSP